ncbi:unnamed protein product, partial [Effrenium voratum]
AQARCRCGRRPRSSENPRQALSNTDAGGRASSGCLSACARRSRCSETWPGCWITSLIRPTFKMQTSHSQNRSGWCRTRRS